MQRKTLGKTFTLCCALTVALWCAVSSAQAASATVSWDANQESDLAGYLLHYGASPGAYEGTQDTGATTSYDLPGLPNEGMLCVAVSAYDTSGNESPLSQEVCATYDHQAPAAPTGLTVTINPN